MVAKPVRLARRQVRRVVVVPTYWVGIALATVAAFTLAMYFVSVAKANENARDLIARYEADKVRTAESNRVVYCTLFGSQADAFAEAQTPAGRASYLAWLAVYRLVRCQPVRK